MTAKSRASDIATSVNDLLEETAISYETWWAIADTLRKEIQKLIDRRELMTDPVYLSMTESLIRDGTRAYNDIVSIFINAGLIAHAEKERRATERKITIARDIVTNGYNKKD